MRSLVIALGGVVLASLAGCSAGPGVIDGSGGDGGAPYIPPTTSASGAGGANAGGGGAGGEIVDWSGSSSSTDASSSSSGPPPCADGTIVCDGSTKKVCDGMGGFKDEEACDPAGVCAPNLGCAVCLPGAGSCDAGVASYCKSDGTGFVTENCDALQGMTCNGSTGRCEGSCSATKLGTSYIGCDYYPTVTANLVGDVFHFAVAISNTSATPANFTITQGTDTITSDVVAANDVKIVQLPWVASLKAGNSVIAAKSAYRLRTDQPVTAYQFNPLEYKLGDCPYVGHANCSYTNDASILLPSNVWTNKYDVLARPVWSGYGGFFAITAGQDNTTITVNSPIAASSVKAGVPGLATNGSGTIVLQAGDVAQVVGASGDVTGTFLEADKPIQVIGGHQCTNVPSNITACDHLEEVMFPRETLSNSYIVTAPLIKAGVTKVRMVRILATKPGTMLSYDPPQSGAPATIAQAGEYIELALTNGDFVITASEPVAVAEYFTGQSASSDALGDPAMTVAIGKEQYRTSYLFHAPLSYSSNFANITCPTGANVTVDGASVGAGTPIGASGYSVIRLQVANNATGNHTLASDQKCGLSVYGYGLYTSYWYPGGSDLTRLHQ